MPNSLRCKLSKLRFQGKITQDEYKDLIKKLEGHDEAITAQIKWERDTAINQLEQLGYGLGEKIEPFEDCVSREAVNKLKKYRLNYDTNTTIPKADVFVKIADIVELPSIKPQRPPGKWLDKKMTIKGAHGMAYGRYACSVCKKKFPNKSNYCPDCGAEMEGKDETDN